LISVSARSSSTIERTAYAQWFETFTWDWYLTLTFSREISLESAYTFLNRYLDRVEGVLRCPLACLIAPERSTYSGCGKPGGRVHFHLLVACSAKADAALFRRLWLEFSGTYIKGEPAHVVPYDRTVGGAVLYLLKQMRDRGWDYKSRNLDMASPVPPKSASSTSRGRRRHRRHVQRCLESGIGERRI